MIMHCIKLRIVNNMVIIRIIRKIINKSKKQIFQMVRYCIYLKQYRAYKKINNRFDMKFKDIYPCLRDNTKFTTFSRHYIYHPAWAARIINKNNPRFHVDISSTLHFGSILSSFIPVKFYDYRPANLVLDNLESSRADLLDLQFENNSIQSLSCMHTVEHIGLGRYGDPFSNDGDLKAMGELSRVLAINGNLLFVVPIGSKSIIQFNAHRIYTKDQILQYFDDFGLTLVEFTLIPEKEEDGGLVNNPSRELLSRQKYACGCFWFVKKSEV